MNSTPHDGTDPHEIRIGTRERQDAADALSQHFAEGRLDTAEFEERTAAAWNAKTRADVNALFFDLPGGSLDGYLSGSANSSEDFTTRQVVPVDSETATEDSSAIVEAPTEEQPSRAIQVLRMTIPLISLALFFVLRLVVPQVAWLAFLLIPLVWMATATGGEGRSRQKRLNNRARKRG